MNPNLPHAAEIIRDGVATFSGHGERDGLLIDLSTMCVAEAAVQAGPTAPAPAGHSLRGSRVLHRTPPRPATDTDPAEEAGQQEAAVTLLGETATARDAACPPARRMAAGLRHTYGRHPDVAHIAADHVTLFLTIPALPDWYAWLDVFAASVCAIGAQRITTRPDGPGRAAVATGEYDGVPVRLIARGVPEPLRQAARQAGRLYWFAARIYDLSAPLYDDMGDVWTYNGENRADGMPLLVHQGTAARCTLANVVRLAGLRPFTGSAPAATGDGTGAGTGRADDAVSEAEPAWAETAGAVP